MSEPYHKYVFNDGVPVLEFEKMYAAEDDECFDAWRQNDVRQLRIRLVTEILRDWNFSRVLDIGCGKGLTSALLKRKNNYVSGIDMSPTAIAKARASFPDIDFSDGKMPLAQFNLISIQGTLAYIETWKNNLRFWAGSADHCVVSEYVPPNPVGYVKSIAELVVEFERYFVVKTKIILNDEIVILFGKSK